MKLPSDSETTSFNDEDINKLFKKQTVNVPTSLDSAILAASKSEATATKIQRSSTSPAPWLAIAATVVMAAIIAPLMLTSPESSLESEPLNTPIQENIPTAISIQADDTPAMTSAVRTLQSPKAMKKPVPRALISSDSAESFRMELDFTEELEGYRNTPIDWIKEINRLISEDRLSQAEEEYDLFKAVHPTHASNIKFPEK